MCTLNENKHHCVTLSQLLHKDFQVVVHEKSFARCDTMASILESSHSKEHWTTIAPELVKEADQAAIDKLTDWSWFHGHES